MYCAEVGRASVAAETTDIRNQDEDTQRGCSRGGKAKGGREMGPFERVKLIAGDISRISLLSAWAR